MVTWAPVSKNVLSGVVFRCLVEEDVDWNEEDMEDEEDNDADCDEDLGCWRMMESGI